MSGRKMLRAMIVVFAMGGMVLAGDGYPMKCMDGKDADGKTVKGCGYQTMVTFGGGMMFEQLTSYCRSCEKFVYLSWTRKGSPLLKEGAETTPKPVPLGQVWDGKTGRILTVHACPHCKGACVEIKGIKELAHCPKCNAGNFKVDPTQPRLAID